MTTDEHAAHLPQARVSDPPRRADIRGLYQLALGRLPESSAAEASFLGQDFNALVAAFFGCDEFVQRVIRPLEAGRRLEGVTPIVDPRLQAWAGARLPLSADGCHDLRSAKTWAGLYRAIAGDPVFKASLDGTGPLFQPDVMAALDRQADLHFRLEAAGVDRVTGWAYRSNAVEPIDVELWINGGFASGGRADLFRRDIQDWLGGSGITGFDLPVPEGYDDGNRRLVLEVRERDTGLVLGSSVVTRSDGSLDGLSAVRAELAQVRTILNRLEQGLPSLGRALSIPLGDYGRQGDRRGRPLRSSVHSGLGVMVWIDALGAPAPWVEQAVWSACDQSHEVGLIVLSVGPGQAALARDLANRVGWKGAKTQLVVEVQQAPVSAAARLGVSLVSVPADVDVVVVMDAATVLKPNAIASFAGRFAADERCQAVYGDEDAFTPDDPGGLSEARGGPILRPAYDYDLLTQTPYVGGLIAFRRQSLLQQGTADGSGALFAAARLLDFGSEPDAVAHVSEVVASRHDRLGPPVPEWAEHVAAHLTTHAGEAWVESHDKLGIGATRVRRAAPAGTRATVVIPTRDGLDLLKACIESLLSHRGRNRTMMDILVVDHASQEPETLAWLAAHQTAGNIRVLPFDGSFNWALMNNLAAEETDADVLVFLNNDTLVVTPDWLDEMVSQAMRPGVGVVGCRLLYGDGTIQHAGFVARESEAAFLVHEGVGRPVSDPGYLGRHVLLRRAAAVTGACMAVKVDTFRTLGGFDAANFPVEGNDVDLCFRARDAGLSVLYDPYATLYHLESKTRGFSIEGERKRVAEAASTLLWRRWGEKFGRDPYYNAHFDRLSAPFTRLRPPADFDGD